MQQQSHAFGSIHTLVHAIRRSWIVLLGFALALALLYVLPSGLELILIRRHVSAWSCVLIGDVAGCLFLFKLGFRKTALALYLVASGVESLVLSSRLLKPESLVWITNLVPALLSGSIVTWIVILWSIPQE